MENTLFSGDRVLVSKSAYGLRMPFTKVELFDGEAVARGDVVIFDSPRDGTRLIKRIVGIGGDRIDINAGHLMVGGDPAAHGVGNIGSVAPRVDETWDDVGWILEIGIHHDHCFTAGLEYSCGDGRLVAEVARQGEHSNAVVAGRPFKQPLVGCVRAAVVDDHDFR